MKIELKQLILFNFRSYLGKHVINFSESGLMLIDGEKSGVGKSNILSAIAFALEFPNFSIKDTQSWNSEELFYVELFLCINNKELQIHKGDRFWFKFDNELHSGINEAISNDLALILNSSPKIRKALIYRPQRTPGFFLSMGDADKKEFLTKLLNLDWIEAEIEKSNKIINKLEKESAVNITLFNNSKSKFELEQQSIAMPDINIEPILEEIDTINSKISELNVQMGSYEEKLSSIKKNTINKLNLLNDEYSLNIDYIEQKPTLLNSLIKNYKELELIINNLKNKKQQDNKIYLNNVKLKGIEINDICNKDVIIQQLKEKKQAIVEENKQIKKCICPKCSQTLPKDNTLLLINNNNIQDIDNSILKLELDLQRLPELNGILLNIQSKYKTESQLIDLEIETQSTNLLNIKETLLIENNNFQLKKENQTLEFKNKKHELELEIQKEFTEMEGLVNSKKFDLSILISDYKEQLSKSHSNKQLFEFQQLNYQNKLKIIEKCKKELEINELQMHSTIRHLNLEKNCKLILKGFLDNIFEELIQDLSQETNNILLYLSNVSHITINFNIDRKTLKGETKFRITPVAYFNGIERSLNNASGGMMTSIELAIDMALANIIAKRSGVNFNFMMLDEAFDGHDSSTKEGCLDMFSKYSKDKLFLIIDHSVEMKEMFTQTLYITSDGKNSQIIQ